MKWKKHITWLNILVSSLPQILRTFKVFQKLVSQTKVDKVAIIFIININSTFNFLKVNGNIIRINIKHKGH